LFPSRPRRPRNTPPLTSSSFFLLFLDFCFALFSRSLRPGRGWPFFSFARPDFFPSGPMLLFCGFLAPLGVKTFLEVQGFPQFFYLVNVELPLTFLCPRGKLLASDFYFLPVGITVLFSVDGGTISYPYFFLDLRFAFVGAFAESPPPHVVFLPPTVSVVAAFQRKSPDTSPSADWCAVTVAAPIFLR